MEIYVTLLGYILKYSNLVITTYRVVLTHRPNGHLPGDPKSRGAPQAEAKNITGLGTPNT